MDGTAAAQLANRVDEIRADLAKAKADGWLLNEADTEHKVIDRILDALGYKHFDIRKRGHDSVANNFADYTLLPSTPEKWFLEVKKLDLPLQDNEALQAFSYAFAQGAQWAVLTNGRKWYIYNAHVQKTLAEKRVFQIDDLFENASSLKTLALLSRSSMLAGGLTKAWLFERTQTIVKVQLETPTSVIRKRLRQIVFDETKVQVSDALIEQVLHSLLPTFPPTSGDEDETSSSLPLPDSQPPVAIEQTHYTFAQVGADSMLGTGRKPTCLHFSDGTSTAVTAWADAGIAALTRAAERFGLPQMPFNNRSKGKTYFLNTEPMHGVGQAMKSHRTAQVNGTTICMDTNRSSQDIAGSVSAALKSIGAPADFVKVSIK